MKTRTSLIALLTAALLFGIAWSVAAIDSTPCQRWDVSGQWELRRDDGETVKVNLQQGNWQQQSANLTGRGELYVMDPGSYSKLRAGEISGNITGNSFTIAILVPMVSERQDGYLERVRFKGTVGPSGKIDATKQDKTNRRWVSSRRMKCADQPASPPTPQNPITTAPTSPGAPKINASPRVVSIPAGQTRGTVTLTWDGGPDHPHAEVWMKEGSQGEEKFVVEQGKGTRRVTVEGGKNYQFILTDAGEQLARVVVSTKQ